MYELHIPKKTIDITYNTDSDTKILSMYDNNIFAALVLLHASWFLSLIVLIVRTTIMRNLPELFPTVILCEAAASVKFSTIRIVT